MNKPTPAPTPAPKRICTLPENVATHSLTEDSAHMRWLVNQFGEDEAERIRESIHSLNIGILKPNFPKIWRLWRFVRCSIFATENENKI